MTEGGGVEGPITHVGAVGGAIAPSGLGTSGREKGTGARPNPLRVTASWMATRRGVSYCRATTHGTVAAPAAPSSSPEPHVFFICDRTVPCGVLIHLVQAGLGEITPGGE